MEINKFLGFFVFGFSVSELHGFLVSKFFSFSDSTFSKIKCLFVVHGSWLKAHGLGPAGGRSGGSGPGRAPSHEP